MAGVVAGPELLLLEVSNVDFHFDLRNGYAARFPAKGYGSRRENFRKVRFG